MEERGVGRRLSRSAEQQGPKTGRPRWRGAWFFGRIPDKPALKTRFVGWAGWVTLFCMGFFILGAFGCGANRSVAVPDKLSSAHKYPCAEKTKVCVKEIRPLTYETTFTEDQSASNRPLSVSHTDEGLATWYGRKYHGRRTASGERFDMHDLTAAHKTLPFETLVKVTHLANSRSVIVRINDRGPFCRGCIIDLSHAGAKVLGLFEAGRSRVRIEVLGTESVRPATAVP